MYRINDKAEAVRQVQIYLNEVTDGVYIAPSGVFDENTRLAVIDFQKKSQLDATGIVDLTTFELLFSEYSLNNMKNQVNNQMPADDRFPLSVGDSSEMIYSVNKNLARLLDHYGITHRLRASAFYSEETARAVREMRRIYMLEDSDTFDAVLYFRLIKDLDSISNFR